MTGLTPKKKRADRKARFLRAYAKLGTILHACRAAGISRETFYNWCEEDPEFKAASDRSYMDSIDALERVAIKRATEGKSDLLTIFLLKGGKPQKYRERQSIEHSGPDGQPFKVFVGIESDKV